MQCKKLYIYIYIHERGSLVELDRHRQDWNIKMVFQ